MADPCYGTQYMDNAIKVTIFQNIFVPSISLSSELISRGAVQPVQLQKSYKSTSTN